MTETTGHVTTRVLHLGTFTNAKAATTLSPMTVSKSEIPYVAAPAQSLMFLMSHVTIVTDIRE